MSSLSKKPRGQMSDSFLMAAFIIMSGGLQDAYTYCCRDKVFANAQTGNIVLMSTHLFAGDWSGVSRYFVPVLSFMAGIFVAECVHRRYKRMEKVHWRQIIILAEIVLLFVVGFLPQRLNTLPMRLFHCVCAMQVQTLPARCLRSRLREHDVHRQHAQRHGRAVRLFPHARQEDPAKVDDLFCSDRCVCARRRMRQRTDGALRGKGLWVSCILLTISFLMMFVREDVEKA